MTLLSQISDTILREISQQTWTFALRNPGSVSYSRDGELKIGDDVTYYQSESKPNPTMEIG